MEKIKPIQRPSVGEQVSDQLKEYLLDGRWKPGEKIPSENDLAQAFGVSRVTIREAVLRLTSLGLLESKFGGGTYVKEFTPGLNMNAIIPAAYLDTKSILDVIEFRQVVEVKTAVLAARRATPDDLEELEDILARMEKWKEDPKRFAEEDLEFHLELAKITENSLLIETLNVIRSLLSQAMLYAVQHRGYNQGLSYHRLLIDAIAKHDEQMTMRIMEEHINDVYLTMEQWLRQQDMESAKD